MLRRFNLLVNVGSGRGAIRFPIMGGMGAQHFSWTPGDHWLEELLGKTFKTREGALVDVGANVGQTLAKFLRIRRGQPYYGFEPNPICCAYLQTFRQLNHLEDVTIIPAALSDHSGVARLFVDASANSSASIVEGFRQTTDHNQFQYVPILKGDEAIHTLGIESISVLKIDVEGAELEVALGLGGTIERFKPIILCEILPVYDEMSPNGRFRRARTEDLLHFLRNHGYRFARVLHDGTVVPLTRIETHGDLTQCDYIFAPEESLGWLNKDGIALI
jgi:FkbM family methyltransferase